MYKKIVNDLDLINGIKDGNTQVIDRFIDEYFPVVRRYIKRKGGSEEDAKDVMQEAFYSLLVSTNNPDFVLRKSLGAYFIRISKNIWIKRIKEMVNDRQFKFELLQEMNFETEIDNFDHYDLIRSLYLKHVKRLKKECQEILFLIMQGLPYKVIAEKMNLNSEVTARVRKKYCWDKLVKDIWNDNDFKTMNDEQ